MPIVQKAPIKLAVASKFQGVGWNNGSWQAKNGRVYLGRFLTEETAALRVAQAQKSQSGKPQRRNRLGMCKNKAKVGLFKALYPLYKAGRFQADLEYTWAQLSTWLKHGCCFHCDGSM